MKVVITGESVDGEYIEYEFEGDVDQITLNCEKTLAFCGGGHLDVWDETGEEFLWDVEW